MAYSKQKIDKIQNLVESFYQRLQFRYGPNFSEKVSSKQEVLEREEEDYILLEEILQEARPYFFYIARVLQYSRNNNELLKSNFIYITKQNKEDFVSQLTINYLESASIYNPSRARFSTWCWSNLILQAKRPFEAGEELVKRGNLVKIKVNQVYKAHPSLEPEDLVQILEKELNSSKSLPPTSSQAGLAIFGSRRFDPVQIEYTDFLVDQFQDLESIYFSDNQIPLENLEAKLDCPKILAKLSFFPEKVQAILSQRFGLGTDEPSTLAEIGINEGFSRERIRQLINRDLTNLSKALEKVFTKTQILDLYSSKNKRKLGKEELTRLVDIIQLETLHRGPIGSKKEAYHRLFSRKEYLFSYPLFQGHIKQLEEEFGYSLPIPPGKRKFIFLEDAVKEVFLEEHITSNEELIYALEKKGVKTKAPKFKEKLERLGFSVPTYWYHRSKYKNFHKTHIKNKLKSWNLDWSQLRKSDDWYYYKLLAKDKRSWKLAWPLFEELYGELIQEEQKRK
tara:strand:- start:7512 stop:9035 length:1524 start_codon:yes stop_codon:yes gene_type:complete